MSISYHLHLTLGSERSIALLRITQRERKDMCQSWSSQPPWPRMRKTMIRIPKMKACARQICSSCLKWYWPIRGCTRKAYLETPAFDVRWWRESLYTLPMVLGESDSTLSDLALFFWWDRILLYFQFISIITTLLTSFLHGKRMGLGLQLFFGSHSFLEWILSVYFLQHLVLSLSIFGKSYWSSFGNRDRKIPFKTKLINLWIDLEKNFQY